VAFRVRLGKPGNPLFRVAPARVGGGQVQALGVDCATFSLISSNRPIGRVLIRRQIQGRIINIWLLLIAVLGAVIAIADGLTRTPVLEREAYWNGPLEYQPYLGAVLLAGLTLALMFGYVRHAGISVTEGFFLWFVFCTTAYTRDFSYIHWPGTPFFVTEIVLVLLFLSIFVLARSRDVHVPLSVNVFLAMLVAAGALSAVRGFLQHSEPILVLRDAALVVYPLFLHVAHHLFRSWLSIKRMAVWFLLGTSLSVLNGLSWFIVAPGERHLIYYGIYVLISLTGILLAIANQLVKPLYGWLLAAAFCIGLILANARTLYVALAALLFIGLLAGPLVQNKARLARLVATVGMVSTLATLASLPFLYTRTGREFSGRALDELASGVLHSSNDPYWQFRLIAWKEAWTRFEEQPLVGEGFGVPFVFELADADVRPHNTFLTVLYKMGLIGFLPLLGLLVYILWLSLRAARRNLDSNLVAFLQIMVLAQVAFCLYGTANLLLESPFLASLFWAAMGIGLRMIRMLDAERLPQKYVYAVPGTDECASWICDKRADFGLGKGLHAPSS
jgi:O-antigen ligase